MDKVETEKTFPLSKSDNPEDQVKPMDWANEGILPIGETRLKPTQTGEHQARPTTLCVLSSY